MPFGFELIIIFLMLILNGIFAAYEMALASISRARLSGLVAQKKKGADDAVYMKDRMESSLAVIQVGITLVGAIAAATGGAGVAQSVSPYLEETWKISRGLADFLALIILIVPLSGLTIVFGELLPKVFALNNQTTVCLALSPVMKLLSEIFYPIIFLFEKIIKAIINFAHKNELTGKKTEDQISLHELNAAASLARTSRLIGAREEKIVFSAAQLSVRPVRDIMLPITEVSMIPMSCSLNDALVRAHMDMHTRFPVSATEGDPQTIQGYINFKDIIAALKLSPSDPSTKGIIRPIKSVDHSMPISQALERMMLEKLHIILVSQNNQITGMVTLEDIIEELVGEIEDEYDRLPNHIHPLANGWIMGGGVLMTTVFQTAGIPYVPKDAKDAQIKLSDWCEKKLGTPLKGGEYLEGDGLQVIVRKLRRKKLGEASVHKIEMNGNKEISRN